MTALDPGRQEPALGLEDDGTVEVLDSSTGAAEAKGVARICKQLIAPKPVLPG